MACRAQVAQGRRKGEPLSKKHGVKYILGLIQQSGKQIYSVINMLTLCATYWWVNFGGIYLAFMQICWHSLNMFF